MCNNDRQHVPANQLAAPFRDAGRSLDFPGGLPNLAPADHRIGDSAPVVTLVEGAPQLVMTPWAWKGSPENPSSNSHRRAVLRRIDALPDLTASAPGEFNVTRVWPE